MAATLYVTVIANSAEITKEFCDYLRGVGVTPSTITNLNNRELLKTAESTAVLFPDGFSVRDVVACIGSLRASNAKRIIIVVTSNPQNFRSVTVPDGESFPPVIIPKPAFGWVILDAIRAHQMREPHE